ncbi:MAG TPA: hypothetical protein VFV63_08400, partial [Ilumatobacteraceae bacterium]|nr:hypothetical protein [Ilumatobacteraceae bacterium]
PLVRFAAAIDVGFVHVEEEYRLTPVDGGTELVVDDTVSSRLPGLGRLALRLTRANVVASMARLGEHCRLG